MPWGSGSWGSSPWGDGESSVFGLGNSKLTGMDVIAIDTLLLNWDRDMKNDANLTNPANYAITAEGAGDPVDILEIRTGTDGVSDAMLFIVTAPTIGETYSISVDTGSAIRSADNEAVDAAFNTVKFIGRLTKVDAGLKHVPRVYDSRPYSVYRQIFNAIHREDDLIGGERSDRFIDNERVVIPAVPEIPDPTPVPDTGEWMYLDHVLVGAEGPVNKMEITGLTGNTQEEYLVVFNIRKANVGTAYDLQLRINGALTSREARSLTSVTLKSPETNLLTWLGTTATDTVGEVEVSTRPNPRGSSRDFPKLYRGMGTRGSGSGMNVFAVSGAWNNTADEVISLAIVSTEVDLDTLVNDIAEGSVMEVWRRSFT